MLKMESHVTFTEPLHCANANVINESDANVIMAKDPYHSLLCNFLFMISFVN